MRTCEDCGKETEPLAEDGLPRFEDWDFYMIRPALGAQAGMRGYASGFLCAPCLSKRLGRDMWAERLEREET